MNSRAICKNIGALVVTGLFLAICPATPAQSAKDQRLVHMQKQIRQEIGRYLDGLSLPAPTVAAIEAFLLQREVVVADAIDRGLQQGLSSVQARHLVTAARAKVDAEVNSSFDVSNVAIVKEIIRNYVAYSQIARIFAPHMAAKGVALSSSQTRQLANTLYDCNSAIINTSAPQMRKLVDPSTGLSAVDKLVLAEAASFLSASQQAILQIDLVRITEAMASGKPLILN